MKPTNVSKVRIGNDGYIYVKGKVIVAISTCSSTKLISDALYVPNIDQNSKEPKLNTIHGSRTRTRNLKHRKSNLAFIVSLIGVNSKK